MLTTRRGFLTAVAGGLAAGVTGVSPGRAQPMTPVSSTETRSLERLPCISHQARASSASRGSESIVAKVWFTAQL